jgi:kynurenine formamidase
MGTPPIPSEEELLSWFEQLSNWGRWGGADSLGTLNYISPSKRVASAALVREGVTVSLAADIVAGAPADPGVPGPQRFMLGTGLGLAGPDEPGRPTRFPPSSAFAMEYFGLVFHGNSITHIDALSHAFYRDQMYNGTPASVVNDWQGATVGDVRSLGGGIVSRGVLLDIAAVWGRDWLEPGEAVHPEHLEEAERAAGVTLEEGDVLLCRTGERRHRAERPREWEPNAGRPGYHASCLRWFAERKLAAVGSDVIQDVLPSGYPQLVMPVHTVGLVALGLWLIDNCDLEQLAATCSALERWSFQFVLSPLRIAGATGSPANPLAIL